MTARRISYLFVLVIIMTVSCESDRKSVINELQLNGFKTLAYEHLSKLYAYDITCNKTTMVADFYGGIYGLSTSQISFSPSGDKVIFAVHSSSHPNRPWGDSLIKCDLMSGNVERVAIEGDGFKCPKWSPDGKRIAFFFRNEDRVNKLGIVGKVINGKLASEYEWDSPFLEDTHKEIWWTEEGKHILVKLPKGSTVISNQTIEGTDELYRDHIVYEESGKSGVRVKISSDATAKINIVTGETDKIYRDLVVYEGVDKSKITLANGHAIYFSDNQGNRELLLKSAERIRFINTTRGGEFLIFFEETFIGRSIHVIHVPSRRSCTLYKNRMWSGSYFTSLHLLKKDNLAENVILRSDVPGILREE